MSCVTYSDTALFFTYFRAVTTGGAGGAIAPPIFLDGPKRSRKYEFLNDFLGDLHPLFFGPCYGPVYGLKSQTLRSMDTNYLIFKLSSHFPLIIVDKGVAKLFRSVKIAMLA